MKNVIYYGSVVSSLVLWAAFAWSLTVTERELIHNVISGVGAITLLAHIGEVAILVTDAKMKKHVTAGNIIMTLLIGAFHFMPLYKATR